MNLEQQVTSLDLSKKLKELGVKQESLFYWYNNNENKKCYCIIYTKGTRIKDDLVDYSAFTVAELGEMLPIDYVTIRGIGSTAKDFEEKLYWVCFNDIDGMDKSSTQMELNESDARAKMLIYLIENNLMEINEG